jgi:hypothetical protein
VEQTLAERGITAGSGEPLSGCGAAAAATAAAGASAAYGLDAGGAQHRPRIVRALVRHRLTVAASLGVALGACEAAGGRATARPVAPTTAVVPDEIVSVWHGDGVGLGVDSMERSWRRLPPCAAHVAARAAWPRRALAPFPAALRLPAAYQPDTSEKPHTTWQGWARGDGARLLLSASRAEPAYGLDGGGPGACHALAAGRPMLVSWAEPEARPAHYSLAVRGYLDDSTDFYAAAWAPTPAGRDTLPAALRTLAHRPR